MNYVHGLLQIPPHSTNHGKICVVLSHVLISCLISVGFADTLCGTNRGVSGYHGVIQCSSRFTPIYISLMSWCMWHSAWGKPSTGGGVITFFPVFCCLCLMCLATIIPTLLCDDDVQCRRASASDTRTWTSPYLVIHIYLVMRTSLISHLANIDIAPRTYE